MYLATFLFQCHNTVFITMTTAYLALSVVATCTMYVLHFDLRMWYWFFWDGGLWLWPGSMALGLQKPAAVNLQLIGCEATVGVLWSN